MSENDKVTSAVKMLSSFFDVEESKNEIGEINRFFIPKANIADELDEGVLTEIGRNVVEGMEVDQSSMEGWDKYVERGFKLITPELTTKSEPWDGAANFKSPTIMKSALKFSDRASTELLRSWELVKTKVIGSDDDESKQARGVRTDQYMNYQLNVEMPEWKDEHEKLIYDLPYVGTVFKKTYYDAVLGRNRVNLITYPNFVVNQDAKSIERLRRFTEVIAFSANEVLEKINNKVWSDFDISPLNGSQEQDAEVEEQTKEDNIQTFIEQQGFYDIDGDGYEEPYNFVVHKATKTVVRITPRFEPSDVYLSIDGSRLKESTLDNFLTEEGLIDDAERHEIARIKPSRNLVKYGFIKDPEGGFLDVGYFYLLGAITEAVNATSNQLIDAGTLANTQGGFLARGFRKKLGDMKFKAGQWVQTMLEPQELANGIQQLPIKEPSPTLLALMQEMKGEALDLSSAADLASAIGSNAPAATTLALIQDQQEATGAIVLRIYRSMANEFRQLYILNSKFADPDEYKEVLDDEEANFLADFNIKSMDIIPVANPEISSKVQRLQLAQAEISMIDQVPLAGGKIKPILENFFNLIGTSNVDEIFPTEEPQEALQRLLSENPDLAEMITQQQAQQQQVTDKQIEVLDAEEERKDLELASKLDDGKVDREKTESETILNLEKAETEETKNQSSIYTQQTNQPEKKGKL
jgi:chaperonin GroES